MAWFSCASKAQQKSQGCVVMPDVTINETNELFASLSAGDILEFQELRPADHPGWRSFAGDLTGTYLVTKKHGGPMYDRVSLLNINTGKLKMFNRWIIALLFGFEAKVYKREERSYE